jgi:hypothetical protein
MVRQTWRAKDREKILESALRRYTFRERSGSGIGRECERKNAAGLIRRRADRRSSRQGGNQRLIGAVGTRARPGHLGLVRWTHRSETGMRDGWLGGILTGRANRDIATARSLSDSGGKQEKTQQRHGNHKSHTNPPSLVERQHRVVVEVCGHGSSNSSRDITVIVG